MKTCHRLSEGSAGAHPRAIMVSLQGIPLSRYQASRWMKRLGLPSPQQRKHRDRKVTPVHLAMDHTLNRQFGVDRPNQVWCSEVTDTWTGRCWSYLAVVLDVYVRKPVGFIHFTG